MNMVCILCMIWVWLGIYENEKSWMWFVVQCIGIVESDVYGKCALYCFKLRRLTLGIGNLMSSHSLSAGHVPLGLGRDKYN